MNLTTSPQLRPKISRLRLRRSGVTYFLFFLFLLATSATCTLHTCQMRSLVTHQHIFRMRQDDALYKNRSLMPCDAHTTNWTHETNDLNKKKRKKMILQQIEFFAHYIFALNFLISVCIVACKTEKHVQCKWLRAFCCSFNKYSAAVNSVAASHISFVRFFFLLFFCSISPTILTNFGSFKMNKIQRR